MMKRLAKQIFIKLASVKITVVCLLLLFILTFWGTVAQVDHGLYAAQERYFSSFFFFVFGVVPFPGAQLVLWVMFINLAASSITHFSKTRGWQSVGLKISHFGVLIYFAAAFVTLHLAQESNVHLLEGEGTNVSSSYHEWEIAYWTSNANKKQVTAIDITKSKSGDILSATGLPVTIKVSKFYLNASAFTKGSQSNISKPINASGILFLEPKALLKERERNMAGGVFEFIAANGKSSLVLLFSGESQPTKVNIKGQTHYFILRHKRYLLPFTIRLKDFKAEFYPGTTMAKSYESMVEIIKLKSKRDVRIFMNNPLREKDYTFYQASYKIDANGREYSTLAVVKNAGQLLPYVACFVVFFGLTLHFIMAALRRKRL